MVGFLRYEANMGVEAIIRLKSLVPTKPLLKAKERVVRASNSILK